MLETTEPSLPVSVKRCCQLSTEHTQERIKLYVSRVRRAAAKAEGWPKQVPKYVTNGRRACGNAIPAGAAAFLKPGCKNLEL